MVKIFSIEDMLTLLKKHGLKAFIRDLITMLKHDFCRWDEFKKIPRPAFHTEQGVIELMPIADDSLFSFKYVNGHPVNPENRKQTVVALGQLATTADGYPFFISEMTLLTVLRTAAISALASDLLARKQAKTIGIIGTGVQSEFQIIAHTLVRDITSVRYYDIDARAMEKFGRQIGDYVEEVVACDNSRQVAEHSDIIITCTAAKKRHHLLEDDWIAPGTHINALGGDCPGKTELSTATLDRAKIVVELLEQTMHEGELQCYPANVIKKHVYAELWQLINGDKRGRDSEQELTLFDCVGFALEDFSALSLTYQLAKRYQLGHQLPMIPQLDDPKNLFALLKAVPEHSS